MDIPLENLEILQKSINKLKKENEKLKKDLEVLDIIKRSIFNKDTHKYVFNEKFKGQKFMTIGIYIRGDADINRIQEWLDNGK